MKTSARHGIVAGLLVAWVAAATGASLPPGFTETSWSGISQPTAMAIAPDGRIFVCQQTGALRVIKNGTLLATPFAALTVDSAGERGLLGVAFDPDFLATQYVYVYYTVPGSPSHNRLSRFTADGDVAAAGSESVLLDLNDLSGQTNHNGGAIHFGADGKLYVGVGDNANGGNARVLSNLLGKVLRVGVPPDPLIPTDNPFFGTATGNNQAIWALGLRNPFTFAVQPGTGRIFINDVGASTWEEIDDGIAGSDYGWNICEGPFLQGTSTPCGHPEFTDPVFYYSHGGNACSIAGGDFYDPVVSQFPASYVGQYFFADYCAGWIRTIDPTSGSPAATDFATGISNPVDVHVDVNGSLYYIARGEGKVYKVVYGAGPAPVVSSIAPSSGPAAGGTPVSIAGANFVDGATVAVGGVAAGSVNVVGPGQVTAASPALSPGTLNAVVVTNPDQGAGSLEDGWFADFADVSQGYLFHDDIETIFRAAITGGCGAGIYCPSNIVTRAQMAVFILKGEHGGSYLPSACAATVFGDVPCPGGPFVDWINQLASEGVTGGCGGGNYCPTSPLTRGQMAVFLLKGEHGGAYAPPACSATVFGDVPCPGGPFVDWINQLASEGVTVGCGGGNYCPNVGTPRGQMATFLVRTFAPTLTTRGTPTVVSGFRRLEPPAARRQ